jgi:hypothetical protein
MYVVMGSWDIESQTPFGYFGSKRAAIRAVLKYRMTNGDVIFMIYRLIEGKGLCPAQYVCQIGEWKFW